VDTHSPLRSGSASPDMEQPRESKTANEPRAENRTNHSRVSDDRQEAATYGLTITDTTEPGSSES